MVKRNLFEMLQQGVCTINYNSQTSTLHSLEGIGKLLLFTKTLLLFTIAYNKQIVTNVTSLKPIYLQRHQHPDRK